MSEHVKISFVFAQLLLICSHEFIYFGLRVVWKSIFCGVVWCGMEICILSVSVCFCLFLPPMLFFFSNEIICMPAPPSFIYYSARPLPIIIFVFCINFKTFYLRLIDYLIFVWSSVGPYFIHTNHYFSLSLFSRLS